MLDKILIVDFEDSFTFNIANIVFPYEKSCKVISHQDFFHNTIFDCLTSQHKHAVILGPGPGHPDQYVDYYSGIKKLLEHPKIYVLGICLGHQILGRVLGYEVAMARKQMHGQAVKFTFNGLELMVQRYNSLAVYINGQETDLCHFPQGISYQFHPESVGTHQNEIFFQEMFSFLSTE